MKIFQFQPVRKKPRVYDGKMLAGHAGLVTQLFGHYAQIIIHNLYKIELLEILYEDLPKVLYPDFEPLDPRRAVSGLLSLKNFMVCEPEAGRILEEQLHTAQLADLATFKKQLHQGGKVAEDFVACMDFNRRTCIQTQRGADKVTFIPLRVDEGLELVTMSCKEFDSRYTPIANYPAVRAVLLYKEYATTVGATPEALEVLGQVVSITTTEFKMATAKKAAIIKASKPAAKTEDTKKPKPTAVKKAVKPVAAKVPARRKSDGEAETATEKRETPSQLFQELILEGKLTDAEIFAQVRSKFGLDDKKKGYVAWYRNYLTKQGKNPPAAKV